MGLAGGRARFVVCTEVSVDRVPISSVGVQVALSRASRRKPRRVPKGLFARVEFHASYSTLPSDYLE